ncbi:hypothetical protein FGB62_31g132 [Gracilaria domingensis]|nr:hypothetical protein FGB62_31g132 [Gracilaria domingensis]
MLNHRRIANKQRVRDGYRADLKWGPTFARSQNVREEYGRLYRDSVQQILLASRKSAPDLEKENNVSSHNYSANDAHLQDHTAQTEDVSGPPLPSLATGMTSSTSPAVAENAEPVTSFHSPSSSPEHSINFLNQPQGSQDLITQNL